MNAMIVMHVIRGLCALGGLQEAAPAAPRDVVVTAVLDAPLDAGRTTVWCATFQLAWDELRDTVVKENVRLTGAPPMAGSLNAGRAGLEDLAAGSYVIGSGFGRDGIVEKLRKSLKEHFGAEAPPLDVAVPPGDFLVYAALQRHLPFAVPLDRLAEPIQFHTQRGDPEVSAFGIKDSTQTAKEFKKVAQQVEVLRYNSRDDFAIRLKPRDVGEEIFLERTRARPTLKELIEHAQHTRPAAGQAKSSGLSPGDELRIPVLNLESESSFAELVGRNILNAPLSGMILTDARQHVAFHLDEKGAEVRSQAQIQFKSKFTDKPRRLVFDGPFLLYLKRLDRQHPYLVMWVGDEAALERQ